MTEHASRGLPRDDLTGGAILSPTRDLMFRVSPDGTLLDFRAPDVTALAVPPESVIGNKVRNVLPARVTGSVNSRAVPRQKASTSFD